MKKLILAAVAVTCAVSVFAQGTVNFVNHVTGTVSYHVYAPDAANLNLSVVGNAATDTPAGSTSWAGWTPIGGNGTAGQYGAASTFAQLLGAPTGASSLVPATPVTSFRTGAGAGYIQQVTSIFANIPGDTTAGTFEMVAWDNSSGNYPTWTQASVAWDAGLIAAGMGGTFNLATIGGTSTPPNIAGSAFNLYFIPEPSTFALAGLGAAAMLIFRRRK